MKLGLLVRADNTGLGIQTRAYYKHLKPDKTIIIDISNLNGNEQHYDWYEDAHLIKGIPTDDQIDGILSGIDILLTAETPYNQKIYTRAREIGVKTACVENPEFFDRFRYPDYPLPDLIILPSVWKEEEVRAIAEPEGTKVVQIQHPVDRDDFPFRQRHTSKTINVAGKPAAHDRNGTWEYLQAVPDGIVTTQSDDLAWTIRKRYRMSNVFTNVSNPAQLYTMGDILVLPRKYAGLCLPMTEALSSGMPVIMPNISPNNHLLPREWLVEATVTDHFEPRGRVDIYSVHPDSLRDRIKWVQENIETETLRANEIAESISWTTLKPKWIEALESIL